MRGYRTRPIQYARGVSGKQTAYLRAKPDGRKRLLLFSDSNARNLVHPRVIFPSRSCQFAFSANCLPGADMLAGGRELRSTPFPSIDYLVVALGTNDVANYNGPSGSFSRNSHRVAVNFLEKCRKAYPDFKILLAKILPQTGRHYLVHLANVVLGTIASDAIVPLLDLDVGSSGEYWSDRLHLSDVGLKIYMKKLDRAVTKIIEKDETKVF
ncbi:uncharacterized protein LOC120335056 [Styela clava]